MISNFVCQHCGRTYRCNPRIKNQKFCFREECQNARKRLHDKRTTTSPKGKSLQQARNKRWRDTYPAHVYQKEYRDTHPEYVNRNRELQRERNKKLKNAPAPMIVKTDALSLQPRYDGSYMAFKIKNGKIVKTDTLLLQIQSPPDMEAYSPPNQG